MNSVEIQLNGARLWALGSAALFWPEARVLVISDMHLGKSERIARRSGQMLPPYETADTLNRLEAVIAATAPDRVISLGDSFDDSQAEADLAAPLAERVTALQTRAQWIWIAGNHDRVGGRLSGDSLPEIRIGPLVFRHIALDGPVAGEISGHYHPKVRLPLRGRLLSRSAFLVDTRRVILPSFGTYTGGLCSYDPVFRDLLDEDAHAIVTGERPLRVPMPRIAPKSGPKARPKARMARFR